ncbi:MAG: hypothetical protein JW825_01625 [Candidatus Methanofastidiosa archaeon]|nr:hypothetical protein [Candidatus Methanofastidiosa archaeon]
MRKILALLALISIIFLPVASSEDFTLTIDITASKGTVEQGESFNILVDAEGQYVDDEIYVMEKQVLVEETVFLNGKKIGEGNIPVGAENYVFNPGQTLTLTDTIPCRVPEDTPPGKYTVEAHFYAAAFGSTMEKTRTLEIWVTEAEGEQEEIAPPEIFLSLSPEEMFYGSTSTLTIRAYNPNDEEMSARVLVKKVKKVGEYFLDDLEFELGPFETKEVRMSFNLQQRLTDLCFLAEVNSYFIDGMAYSPDVPIRQEICATILQRPTLIPEVTFGEFCQDGELFTAAMYIDIVNTNEWQMTISPNEVNIELSNPSAVDPAHRELRYFALNCDIHARVDVSGPIEVGSDLGATLSIRMRYPEQYGMDDETIYFNFNFPDSNYIKGELGIESEDGNDNGNGEEALIDADLLSFLSELGSFETLTEEEIAEMLLHLLNWQAEIFT